MGNIIEMKDQIRVYYGGREYLHGGYMVEEDPKKASICLSTLRTDGFVSVDAGANGGYMLTKPIKYPGGKLHINAKTASDGFVRVGVREGTGVRDGEWPEAWRFEKSIPFSGDSTDMTVTWQDSETIDSFPSDVIRLHFWMEKAQVFSFWFD